uniref:CSON005026 protein n=1 Tax=Culicoides sonorensis TaxID=179676 RepID=A0A336MPK0_CULSO
MIISIIIRKKIICALLLLISDFFIQIEGWSCKCSGFVWNQPRNQRNQISHQDKTCSINTLNSKYVSEICRGSEDVDLELHEAGIEFVEESSFQISKPFKRISLYNNKIRTITSNTFNGLRNLEKLELGHNQLRKIDVQWFRDLTNLKEFHVQENLISEIPFELCHFSQYITHLVVFLNKIIHIDLSVMKNKCNSIKYIFLQYNPLNCDDAKHISDNFNSYLDRGVLSMEGSQRIEKLKFESIGELTPVQCLNETTSNDEIQAIDEPKADINQPTFNGNFTSDLITISIIIIAINCIVMLYLGIMSYKEGLFNKYLNFIFNLNICLIDACNSKQNSIPASKQQNHNDCEKLQAHKRNSTFITSISPEIMQKVCLCTLNFTIHDGALSQIEPHSFQSCRKLEVISLENNKIKMIPENAFNGLVALKTLNLAGNRIERVENHWFKEMSKLEQLDLQRNLINFITPNIVELLPKLKTLVLFSNKLEGLNFTETDQLDEIYVADNPFNCSDVDEMISKFGSKINGTFIEEEDAKLNSGLVNYNGIDCQKTTEQKIHYFEDVFVVIVVAWNFLGFGQSAEVDIVFDGAENRKLAEVKTDDGKKEKYLLYFDGEAVSGKVNVTLKKPGSKMEHQGIKIELIGQIELYYDRGNHHEFVAFLKELARPGDLLQNTSYPFEFANVEKPYEVYVGSNVRLRYFLRVTIGRRLSDIVKEVDIAVHTLCSYPEINSPIKMEVGIEDCLHIEFEYNKSKYHLKDVIVGKIYFLLVRIKIKHMEIAIIKRETTGSGNF